MISLLKFVIGMTVLATIAAANEGDGELVTMFAKERKEMREEQKEMRADFRRENDEQNRVIAEQKEEIKKLHKKLHQADLKIQKTNRQRDVKESKELETKISSAIRKERHSPDFEHVVESVVERSIRRSGKNSTEMEMELRELIDDQITNYLKSHRICVGGNYWHSLEEIIGASANQEFEYTVSFGLEFPRKPTVSASIARILNNEGAELRMYVKIDSFTTTSATLQSFAGYGSAADSIVSWLACL